MVPPGRHSRRKGKSLNSCMPMSSANTLFSTTGASCPACVDIMLLRVGAVQEVSERLGCCRLPEPAPSSALTRNVNKRVHDT